MLQWLTFGILAVVTGNQNDIAEPPNAKHPTGEELDNRRARSADVKPVNSEESEEERQQKGHFPAFLLICRLLFIHRLNSHLHSSQHGTGNINQDGSLH